MKRDSHRFKVGDFVQVIAVPSNLTDPVGMGTPEVFKGAVGKVFPIEDIDENGWLSLVVLERHPTEDTYESDTIWIECECVVSADATLNHRCADESAR